ncbi:hypothetical protein DPMN_128439 [Dreissena polymorpha]|uniref:Uncharacterized protein n=1 Tax=Dreissena polymorpha TaxID=45954 RepID=A0A9D4K051_DREPO|nr:hypothetical protein DPMN_128439 [Dreissena polymorpha]
MNKGDVRHLVLQRPLVAGTCSCSINGSTELSVEDFFRDFYSNEGQKSNISNSLLRLDNKVYEEENTPNIVHSHVNVTNVIISFDEYFQRLWLRVDIKGKLKSCI